MSTNDKHERMADKNERVAFDTTDPISPDTGELSQDELDQVSGGRMYGTTDRAAQGTDPADRTLARGDDDKSDAARV